MSDNLPKNAKSYFKPGHDPRRNTVGRPVDEKLALIRGESRLKLMEILAKVMSSSVEDIENFVNNKQMTVAESAAMHYMLQMVSKDTSPAHMQTLFKILGLKFEEPVINQVNVNLSLEELVSAANSTEEIRHDNVIEGKTTILRKKRDG